MKTTKSFLMPNLFLCFIIGLILGGAFYGAIYFASSQYVNLPLKRLLGPIESGGFTIYLILYILFFWGLVTVMLKRVLWKGEYRGLTVLEKNLQSSRIISKRNELDNIRAMITQGNEISSIRNTLVVKILIFLIDHCLITETSERVLEIFNKRLDTLEKDIESSYNILKYIAWAIPSLGFIGTVLGIGAALGNAELAIDNISLVTNPLGMAFDTTLIALVESVILMFFIFNMQSKEEKLLNGIDLFCQEKFIINLKLG